jgi:two-component system cell cycle sensor histidine kinase/response regulator CckA
MPVSDHAARMRGLLEISRIVREGGDLPSKLERMAAAIADCLGFRTVAVNLYRPEWDDFVVAAVHGTNAAQETLLGRAIGWDFWRPLLDLRWERDGAYLILDGDLEWDGADATYVPDLPESDDPEAWRSQDALLAPLRAADGHVLGILAVDEPESGRRPTDEELEVLVAVATHAAQAIESAQEAELSVGYREALEHLLGISSQLTGTHDVDSILQAVCDAVRDALGFELAVIELADRESDRYRPVAAAGIDLGDADLQLDAPIAVVDQIFDPRFEREGCFLVDREEAIARVHAEPPSFASRLNGRGSRAWHRHWLVAPWYHRDGSVAGFIWADDPTDRLIPAQSRLQALRLLANQAATALDSATQFEALRTAEELQGTMLASSPFGIVSLDTEGRVRSWNDAARRMFGYADEDVIGLQPPWLPAEARAGFRAWFAELLRRGGVEDEVYVDVRADGARIDVRTTSAPVRDASGAVTGGIAAIEDITEQKRAAVDLEGRNRELEALHATTLALLDRLEIGSTLETIVARAADLLGATNGVLHLVDREADELHVAVGIGAFAGSEGKRGRRGEGLAGRVYESGEPLTVDDYTSWPGRVAEFTGAGFHASACVPLRSGSEVVGVLGLAYDVPDRTFGAGELALLRRFGHLAALALNNARLVDDLRKSQELYGAIVENSTDIMLLLDLEGQIRYASPSYEALIGYSLQELQELPPFALVHPDDLAGASSRIEEALVGGKPATYMARARHRDGHWLWMEGVPAAVRNEHGEPELVLVIARDVSERLHQEDVLRKTQELYRTVVDNSRDLILLLGLDGEVQYCSPAQGAMLGYGNAEFVGTNVLDLVARDEADELGRAFQAAVSGGRISPQRAQMRRHDGTSVEVEALLAPVLGPDDRPVAILGVVRDTSERRELEEQLRQSQKMEAIGHLAGGIAHDFNNLLTAIAGYGDLALAKLDSTDPVYRNVEEMRRAGARAAALTRQLLAFSRRQVLQPKVLNLNEAVEDMEGMLGRVLGERVDFATVLDADLGYTRADPGQVEQVLMNLAINARDAMPDGGRLTITTANVELDELFVKQHVDATPGQYVMLAVGDTGVGMDRRTLDRVFDPFFTTKPAGQGTGLGLSTVYGIVRQTGGQIWAYSEPGHGSTFKVFLPRVWERAAERVERIPASRRPSGSETVLLVEDEEIVRTLVQEMLEDDGYAVLAASGGGEALELARAHDGPIDVLLTDVVMPGLSGQQLAAQLVEERPDVRVLFASGYAEDAIANHGVLRPGTAFLEKPFTAPELASTLRHLLDGAPGNGSVRHPPLDPTRRAGAEATYK